jgi:hypothetical protein
LIVSSLQRAVPLWFQRAAGDGKGPVIWDYHVVLVTNEADGHFVVDADTTLGPKVAAVEYLDKTFAGVAALPSEHSPVFRLMSAREYRSALSSDRRHMLRPDGSYTAPPPPWNPIGDQAQSNLLQLTDVHRAEPGEVIDLRALRERLGKGA